MNDSTPWLIDTRQPPGAAHLDEIDRELAELGPVTRGGHDTPTVAVSLHDVVIHDTRKWFGEAEVRIDTLVITGYGQAESAAGFYQPKTASFGRVRDGDRLPIGAGGLLVYHGPALHFLDILIMVSRNRQDSQDLAQLLKGQLGAEETKGAVGALLGLAVAAPTVAAVTAALGAAAVLGDVAYRILQVATGATIGLYRSSHLQFRDGFGIGAHPGPEKQCFRVKDLSFRYEITREAAP